MAPTVPFLPLKRLTAQWETHGEVGTTLGLCYPGHAGGTEGQAGPTALPCQDPAQLLASSSSFLQAAKGVLSKHRPDRVTLLLRPSQGPRPHPHPHPFTPLLAPPPALPEPLEESSGILELITLPHCHPLHSSSQHCLMQPFHYHFNHREAPGTAVGLRPFPSTTVAPGTWQALRKY